MNYPYLPICLECVELGVVGFDLGGEDPIGLSAAKGQAAAAAGAAAVVVPQDGQHLFPTDNRRRGGGVVARRRTTISHCHLSVSDIALIYPFQPLLFVLSSKSVQTQFRIEFWDQLTLVRFVVSGGGRGGAVEKKVVGGGRGGSLHQVGQVLLLGWMGGKGEEETR